MRFLVLAGLLLLAGGDLLEWLGVCPAVKRIWTPSWTLWSGGWCFLILAAFYAVIEIRRWKGWAFPLVVVGMNSIAAYCMDGLLGGPVREALEAPRERACFHCLRHGLGAGGARRVRCAGAMADPLLDVPPEAVPADLSGPGGLHHAFLPSKIRGIRGGRSERLDLEEAKRAVFCQAILEPGDRPCRN